MTVFGPLAATAILAAYTLCAWLPELLLLHTAFSSSPALRWGCRWLVGYFVVWFIGWSVG